MTETHAFQAEVQEVLNLVIHSLYSNREIFLRELVSNASDALDKRRIAGLTDASAAGDPDAARIRIGVDAQARTLTVEDDGIGMTRDELAQNLGTIARSGTRGFLAELREKGESGNLPHLIGQFGVGFYASFMVADRITVESRRAGTEEGNVWSSAGDGHFTLEPGQDIAVGTRIRLELKPAEEVASDDEEGPGPDFADPHLVRRLIKQYSDFVEYPIEMPAALFEGEAGREAADGERVVVVNSRRPLWARPKDEVTSAEHAEFYKHLAHDWNDPLDAVHFRVEGTSQYTALLYIPSERPFDLLNPEREKSHVALYVKRVFVEAECEALCPSWLRFVRGVVDSDDLPLNVSREMLQENRAVRQIKRRVTRKVLDCLSALLAERREDYARFWDGFGPIVKEGIVVDPEFREPIADLCLFTSTRDGGPWTLAEYVDRMDAKQEAIYFIAGEQRERMSASPHLEALRKKGFEVLFLTDAVDEWVVERLTEYRGKPLRPVDRGTAPDESEKEREEREKLDREHRNLLGEMELALEEWVREVRFSSRLTDSPAVLVNAENAPSPQMERIMRLQGTELPVQKRILELNSHHPVITALRELQTTEPASDRLRELSRLLHGQAVLAEGGAPPDPAGFARSLNALLVSAARGG